MRHLSTAVRWARNLGAPVLVAALVTAGSPGWGLYMIRSGDTLSDIAAKYHTTVARLVQANHLPGNGSLIYAGSSLRVPGVGGAAATGGSSTAFHRVVAGDTLSGIAAHYGVAQSVIARANRLPHSNVVLLGQTLQIPRSHAGHSTVGSGRTQATADPGNTFAGRTYSSTVVGSAARHRAALSTRGLPSRDGMRMIIAATARANGVSTSLALAVSYQESGWNMGVVSVADAVGAMQVVPATSDWISGVVGRRLDPLDAHDNATTGVVLLRVLTHSASSERQAVAGYYQGLASVQAHGMFPDTKEYVANVMALRARFR